MLHLVIVFVLHLPMITTLTCQTPTPECICSKGSLTELKVLSCRYQALSQIPTFNKTSIVYEKILLSGCTGSPLCNNITSLPANAFANLIVKSIDLLDNPISYVHRDAFSGLAEFLEELKIQGSGTVAPPYQAMASNERLKVLHLKTYNQTTISYNDSSSIFPYPRLQTLTLEDFRNLNSIKTDLLSVIKNLTKLELITIPTLTVENIIPVIRNFPKLTHLTITGTGINNIQAESFNAFASLQELDLSKNNYLSTLDDGTFNGMENTLVHLDLSSNKLSGTGLTFLSAVKWLKLSLLNLGYNEGITTIPPFTFTTLSKLEYLQLPGCRLMAINSSMFAGLTNLYSLDLGYNKITNVAARTFASSTMLTELVFNGYETDEKITSIAFDNDAFGGIETSLEHLRISYYQLNSTQFWAIISMLANLLELQATDTGLAHIPAYAFRNNTKLVTLDLSANNITEIQQEALFGPKNTLKYIRLQSNQIKSLNQCLVNDFPQQPAIYLSHNPLHCDCDLVWFYDWAKNQSSPDLYLGYCSSPPTLADQSLNEINRSEICSSGSNVSSCRNLYITTTTPTPTTLVFHLLIRNLTSTSISLTWSIVNKTEIHITHLRLEMSSSAKSKEKKILQPDISEYTFTSLNSGTYYTFCLVLEINDVYLENHPTCINAMTLTEYETNPEPQQHIAIIAGSVVGGVILIILILIIIVILRLKSNIPTKQNPAPVAFHPTGTPIPQTGNTSKRFTKKSGKAGASVVDVNIQAISNGIVDNGRISAGSYQWLNNDGVNRRSQPNASKGHYANSVEDRPLPKAPYEYKESGGANGRGHVNAAFTNSTEHLPESSGNEYFEVTL